MPDLDELDGDLDDYYGYENATSRAAERVESGLLQLMSPRINIHFSDDEE